MRIRLKPWTGFVLLAAAVTLGAWGLSRYRHRFVRSDADLVGLLPAGEETVFFGNVAALRRANILGLLTAAHAEQETEYRAFVAGTGFDYTRDVEAVAGSIGAQRVICAVRGRFDWRKIRSYTAGHGAHCTGSVCDIPASAPGRWTSMAEVQPDVMLVGNGTNRDALHGVILKHGVGSGGELPEYPLWIRVGHSVLQNPANLPMALRVFAIPLQSSDEVLLSLGAATAGGAQFELRLDARCANSAIASTARTQLELETKMLKLELMREHAQANSGDLSGLLVSGKFGVSGRDVIGTWPITRQLVENLR